MDQRHQYKKGKVENVLELTGTGKDLAQEKKRARINRQNLMKLKKLPYHKGNCESEK